MNVEIYQVDLKQLSFRVALSKLNHKDLTYAANIKHQETLKCFVKSRASLYTILSEYVEENCHDLTLSYNEFGKPALKHHQTLHFNLTHSGHQMMMATAPCPVGIDIERIVENRDVNAAAKMVFSKEENNTLTQTTIKYQQRNFYNIWTKKEAYLKALGCGFDCDPTQISTHHQSGIVEDLTLKTASDQKKQKPWHVMNLNLDHKYASALAIQSKQPIIIIKQLSSESFMETKSSRTSILNGAA